MKTNILIITLLYTAFVSAQSVIPDSLKKTSCDIIAKSTIIKNVEIWNEVGERVEYKENNTLKDFLISDILRIEFNNYFIVLKNMKLILIKEYDKLNGFDDSKGYASNIKPDGFLFSKKGSNSEKYFNSKFNFVTEGKSYFRLEEELNSNIDFSNNIDTISVKNKNEVVNDYVIDNINPAGNNAKEIDLGYNGKLDDQSSYFRGFEDGKNSFDKLGFGVLSCLAIGTLGPLAPAVLTIEPSAPRKELIPKNVDEKLYVEGYKNGKIKQRRKPILIAGVTYISAVFLSYAFVIIYTFSVI